MKKLTPSQIKTLKKHEQHLRTAYFGRWCSAVPRKVSQEVHDILEEVSGTSISFNPSCSACVLDIMTRAGRLYFNRAKKEGQDDSESENGPGHQVTSDDGNQEGQEASPESMQNVEVKTERDGNQ